MAEEKMVDLDTTGESQEVELQEEESTKEEKVQEEKVEVASEEKTEEPKDEKQRIEEVRFDKPISGRYRIGIDYSNKCEGARETAAFAISVLHKGEQIQKVGSVNFEHFEVVVMEFEI